MIDEGPHFSSRQQTILLWLISVLVAFATVSVAGAWLVLVFLSFEEVRSHLLVQHFGAIVGLPAAGAAAFILVFVFRHTNGPVEFEALTFKFKGAAGPAILWIICFLAMSVAIKLVW